MMFSNVGSVGNAGSPPVELDELLLDVELFLLFTGVPPPPPPPEPDDEVTRSMQEEL